ncbi:craniofacial development protein 1 [Kryptolebias marmoratus]|uniref:Craniofacial development protein 1 n=1 Tax=Kryptolebias marmoratus TaxID=37003 RepID=A0A3Q3AM49_KRYMA|nr:craniofacial development protein 1 [Kryptolebias marmoratus]
MNYSDYDSDGYSSNEDADYVPSDDNLSEDDINECEQEAPLHEDDTVPHPDVPKKKRKDISKKKKRLQKLKTEEKDDGWSAEAQLPQEQSDHDAKQKKKSDDLWASFLSDVGSRPKGSAPAAPSAATKEADSAGLKTAQSPETKVSEPAKVTITKVFDFAGEEVRVNKEVSADSKEAKSYLKSQNAKQNEDGDKEETSSPSQPSLHGSSVKRPAGMSSILGRIGGKKQKMSTLEKSKMDWDAFKVEEGITEELAVHNRGKEGYVERKNFLERVDHRQFELEKEVRLSNMKR